MSESQKQLIDEIIDRLRFHVMNQARYIYPADTDNATIDVRWHAGNRADDDTMVDLLADKDIVSDSELTRLAAKIGVADIFSEDSWVEEVASYIVDHKDDCEDLWAYLDNWSETFKKRLDELTDGED